MIQPSPAQMPSARYDELKETVRRGLTTFAEVADALIEIREQRGYQHDGYENFAEFCHSEFDLGLSYAYRMMEAGRVSTIVKTHGLPPPRNEAQARELLPLLPPADQKTGRPAARRPDDSKALVETWRELTKKGEVTAEKVKLAVANKLVEIYPQADMPKREPRELQPAIPTQEAAVCAECCPVHCP